MSKENTNRQAEEQPDWDSFWDGLAAEGERQLFREQHGLTNSDDDRNEGLAYAGTPLVKEKSKTDV